MSMNSIDRLYNSVINDPNYKALPKTKETWGKINAILIGNRLNQDNEDTRLQWEKLEKLIKNLACVNEHQGFVYGFNQAMELFTSRKSVGKNRLDENIRSEYSSLAVEQIDETDPLVDILKEYVPKEKFPSTIDTLCECVNDTKYAVFEQGFLRGIAVAKSGEI